MHAYPFAAVLFDMDGTLIDNVPLHQAVWREFTAQHQLHLSDQQLSYTVGRKAAEAIHHFWPLATPDEVASLLSQRQELYRARLAASDLVKPVAGVEEYLTRLSDMGVHRVLATDAPRANVDAVFRKFPFAHFFEEVITSDLVRHGKPHPEIFLKAANAVSAAPANCLVAEDSLAGVTAAKAAGCVCLGLTTTQTQAELLREGADYVAPDFLTLPSIVAG
ncbi:MAG: HAD family phosphatase [Tepidisphaeraceae bacterium]|jgi:HAD superfamily hydrolase (TIGR01509 family)